MTKKLQSKEPVEEMVVPKWLFTSNVPDLAKKLFHLLHKAGYKKRSFQGGDKYMLVNGSIPVLLVAHLDTVHRTQCSKVFHDKEEGIMWSPQGLGADDRAGVAAILELVRRGHRPYILFTDEEECGGLGAKEAVKKIENKPNVKYVIQLDRMDSDDAVFYSCDNQEFTDFVESFGFVTSLGTYSDISDLCPAWGIAGVNLSVGYYNHHTKEEYLNIKELKETVDRVEKMLITPTEKKFEYVPKYKAVTYINSKFEDEDWWKEYYSSYSDIYDSYDSWKDKDEVKGNPYAGKAEGTFYSTLYLKINFNNLLYEYGGTRDMWKKFFSPYKNRDKAEKYLEDKITDYLAEVALRDEDFFELWQGTLEMDEELI